MDWKSVQSKNTINPIHRKVVPSMYQAILKETICACIRIDGQIIATGLGILTETTSVFTPSMSKRNTANMAMPVRSAQDFWKKEWKRCTECISSGCRGKWQCPGIIQITWIPAALYLLVPRTAGWKRKFPTWEIKELSVKRFHFLLLQIVLNFYRF